MERLCSMSMELATPSLGKLNHLQKVMALQNPLLLIKIKIKILIKLMERMTI
uniref:Uncharacterized protein n=1 Tax=Arundo donax TaxID=35708 RepID=A0A0A8ZTY4_ARUDO